MFLASFLPYATGLVSTYFNDKTVYPPIMMYSVLLAAAYIITLKQFKDKAIAAGKTNDKI